MLAALTAPPAEEHAADDAAVHDMREFPQPYASVSVVTTHIVTVDSVSDECRCSHERPEPIGV
eukprot:909655-Prymnesium_polylepis.1